MWCVQEENVRSVEGGVCGGEVCEECEGEVFEGGVGECEGVWEWSCANVEGRKRCVVWCVQVRRKWDVCVILVECKTESVWEECVYRVYM